MELNITVTGLDDFYNDIMDMVQKQYPKEIKKFMQAEGNKLRKETKKKANSTVRKKTGNYLEGMKRGKYYIYKKTNASSIRVYAGRPANHAHLLEEGHKMVRHDKVDSGKFVKGYHIFKLAANEFESTYAMDCEKFASKITNDLN